MAKKKNVLSPEALEFFRKHGRRGGLIGGKIASENMTDEQKRERALRAVAARKWHKVLTPAERAARAAEKARNKRPVGRPRKEGTKEKGV